MLLIRELYYRHEAAVSVVNKQITAHGFGSDVIDTARPIRHVTHDYAVAAAKPRQYVDDGARKQQEAFRELQRDTLGAAAAYSPNGLVNLKAVVGRQQSDGFIERRVGRDVIWYERRNPTRGGRRSRYQRCAAAALSGSTCCPLADESTWTVGLPSGEQ